jgi:hypothetical protein
MVCEIPLHPIPIRMDLIIRKEDSLTEGQNSRLWERYPNSTRMNIDNYAKYE